MDKLTDVNFELRILKPYLEKIINAYGDVVITLCDESFYRITRRSNVFFQLFMAEKANSYFKLQSK